jgi:hypothetical protein
MLAAEGGTDQNAYHLIWLKMENILFKLLVEFAYT